MSNLEPAPFDPTASPGTSGDSASGGAPTSAASAPPDDTPPAPTAAKSHAVGDVVTYTYDDPIEGVPSTTWGLVVETFDADGDAPARAAVVWLGSRVSGPIPVDELTATQ